MSVKVWSEKVSIPTYEIGEPEKNPMFLEKRVYQGSSGKVYPFPVIEKISDEKVDKEWLACFLENDYVKIMILPELGGRVQMAYDKMKKRHFVYYNEVIKPALVGLAGPWISGGIEFNWPQHHRPSTYDPVDFYIEENEDGGKTVWCSEMERMTGTKGMAGFKLYPDKAYLEINVKLYNRTSRPQSFLWWANPAVAVNDDYQSVFPPDVNAVFDHGKRDVSEFPIAKGTYYKFDYSPGTDISRYKNIPVPTSYMAIRSDYNFVGGYENDSKGGLLHVANHHVSPGKKQWTWGNGDFGIAWDRNLTDKNGPYIELMCGVYTDNQPDFSWLMPYEEKAFTQYFMPYQDIGVVKNASKDAMLNLEFKDNKAIIKVYTTGVFPKTAVKLEVDNSVIDEAYFDFKPGTSYYKEITLPEGSSSHECYISVVSEEGRVLIDWKPEKEKDSTIPEAAKPAKLPADIETNEELYLNGLHLEQYRHATFNPEDYYKEALKRDSNDIRCNNAMGLLLLRKGKFAAAETYFSQAYKRQINRNPNPYDGEPLFNLGLSLYYQGKYDEAYGAFYKSVWNAAYMDSGYFHIAQIDAIYGNWDAALDTVQRSLLRNWSNHKARHLKAAILRKKGLNKKAKALIDESLDFDRFNFGMYFESHLLGDDQAKSQMKELMRDSAHNYIEIALDYAGAGMYTEAIQLLDLYLTEADQVYPMSLYFKGYFLSKEGKEAAALKAIEQAETCSPNYCFPHRVEATLALDLAMKINPEGARASYYLGNFWYNANQYEDAVKCWEASISRDDTFSIAFRNLALAYFNKMEEKEKALDALEMAFELNPKDSRIFLERDQLYKRLNKSVAFRFEQFENHLDLVKDRDDLYIEWVYLYILNNDYAKGYELIMQRKFHPWEGGEGKVTTAYVACLIGLAKESIQNKNFEEARAYLEKTKTYPHNLGEGKLQGAQENEINYWLGCAYEGLGDLEKARDCWTESSVGVDEPSIAWFYNDQQPDTIFYQGLALLKLGKQDDAVVRFDKLIDYGNSHVTDKIKIDYFAVSLPDLTIWDESLSLRNKCHCYYLMALGYKGKGDNQGFVSCLEKVKAYDQAYLGATLNELVYES
ncbi:DUF5107 domain-containing protein [Flavivirga eckloniae]|uniref:DUF5107 domain-containing protein n=1 Tax=Flavivirga eckloniae TaxID=1803846 RepID=A0A2K9PU73_9FLAO|nr:DUF5107 domain-containing protein [Flavivirga eckloniae]AUP80611.1 DUF5107 domain-containing protein [Flavivirga eckloniae]